MREYLGMMQLIYNSLGCSDHQILKTMQIYIILVGLFTEYEHAIV